MLNRKMKVKKLSARAASAWLLLAIFLLLFTQTAGAVTPEGFAGGEGKEQNPWQISTPAQLDLLRNYTGAGHRDKHFELVNDIDLGEYIAYKGANVNPNNPDGKGWLPIGAYPDDGFCGVLEGNNFHISNLAIYRVTNTYKNSRCIDNRVGLFAYIGDGGRVSNMHVSTSSLAVQGYGRVGILAGNISGTVDNCSSSGSVYDHNNVANRWGHAALPAAGGLVGDNDGTITNSSSSAYVFGYYRTGGLVGLQYYGTISNSYATGTVDNKTDAAGGLVGDAAPGQSIQKSYATGSVYSASVAGGLVGKMARNGSITECFAEGMVAGGKSVGGLAGEWAGEGTVANNYSTSTVTLTGDSGIGCYMGGLFGRVEVPNDASLPTTLSNCYFAGSIAPGVLGWKGSRGHIATHGRNIAPTNLVYNSDTSIGNHEMPVRFAYDCNLNSIYGRNTAQMKTLDCYASLGWSISSNLQQSNAIWFIEEGASYPTLRWRFPEYSNNSYLIRTASELDNMRAYAANSNGVTWKLANDISLAAYCKKWGAAGWLPIDGFNGTFDGDGHTISGLQINRPDRDSAGLFGGVSQGASFKNVTVTNDLASDHRVIGRNGVGLLVGFLNGGTIENVSVSGGVTGNNHVGGLVGYLYNANVKDIDINVSCVGNDYLGGLAGYSFAHISNATSLGVISGVNGVGGLIGQQPDGGTITNCGAYNIVIGRGNYVGGLVGELVGTATGCTTTSIVEGKSNVGGFAGRLINKGAIVGTLEQCRAYGTVKGDNFLGGLAGYSQGKVVGCSASGNVTGGDTAGGLIGQQQGTDGIAESYATGKVQGGTYLGGLVGDLSSPLSDSYARGSVNGTSNLGGLVGFQGESTVSRCYATGAVGNGSDRGGLIGKQAYAGTSSVVEDSFYDSDTTGIAAGTAGSETTTAEMHDKATYANWDFDSVWDMFTDGTDNGYDYPYLRTFNNGILIKPTNGDGEKTVDYKPMNIDLTWDVEGDYNEQVHPLSGALQYSPGEPWAPGLYRVALGTLGNPYYQISFLDDKVFRVKELGHDEAELAALLEQMIAALPNPVETYDDANEVAALHNLLESQTQEVKARVSNAAKEQLEAARQQCIPVNHRSNNFSCDYNLPWHVRIQVKIIAASTEEWRNCSESMPDVTLESLYEISLWDTLTNQRYTLPQNQNIEITIDSVHLNAEADNVLHYLDDSGAWQELAYQFAANTLSFTSGQLGQFALTSYVEIILPPGPDPDPDPDPEPKPQPKPQPQPEPEPGPEPREAELPFIKGYPDGTFLPEKSITRAETLQISYNVFVGDQSGSASLSFVDADNSHWAAKTLTWAKDEEYILGYPDNTLRPDQAITRAEVAVIIHRIIEANEITLPPAESPAIALSDISEHWARASIEYLVGLGIITGYEDNTYRPDHEITRVETVMICWRLLQRSEDFTPSMMFSDLDEGHWAYNQIMNAACGLEAIE